MKKEDTPVETTPPVFEEGQKVKLVIGNNTELGYKAVVNDTAEGMLYRNEVFQKLKKGDGVVGFIKKVREDGKIDLCLQWSGPEKVDEVSQKILDRLKGSEGFLPVPDKTPPHIIYSLFGVSKKTYKKAIGGLYKKRLILIGEDGIRLA